MMRIEATGGLIDAIVYRLYGLTEDEIKIVEESISGLHKMGFSPTGSIMFSTYDTNFDEFKALIKKFASELIFPFEEFFIEKEESKSESEAEFLHYTVKYYSENKDYLKLFVEIAKKHNFIGIPRRSAAVGTNHD